jgi:hypothetical protein
VAGQSSARASIAPTPHGSGRAANPAFDCFREAKVAIIGCGSISAAVAVLLAQSGIGSIVLLSQFGGISPVIASEAKQSRSQEARTGLRRRKSSSQ